MPFLSPADQWECQEQLGAGEVDQVHELHLPVWADDVVQGLQRALRNVHRGAASRPGSDPAQHCAQRRAGREPIYVPLPAVH